MTTIAALPEKVGQLIRNVRSDIDAVSSALLEARNRLVQVSTASVVVLSGGSGSLLLFHRLKSQVFGHFLSR